MLVKTSPDAPAHKQQSQILVPIDTKGVNILEGMEVFGHDDAPHGDLAVADQADAALAAHAEDRRAVHLRRGEGAAREHGAAAERREHGGAGPVLHDC